ncbi:MAG TPA: HAD family hydrolase [Gemmatimonadaceae bacterium]|jgi:histidinol-phosphate phosphatase family protein
MNEPPKRRAAFLDRDGTLITDVHYLADPESLVMMPNADLAVRALNDAGWLAIVVTNQSGIARGLVTEEQYQATAQRLREVFAARGARIDAMYHCPHHPDFTGPCECRKPGTLLFRRAAADFGIDFRRSAYIGDRLRDVQQAQTLGGVGIMVPVPSTPADELERAKREFVVADTLMEAVRAVLAG